MTIKKQSKKATVPVLMRDIPRNLRDHWKSWCAMHGISMRDSFLEFLKEVITRKPS